MREGPFPALAASLKGPVAVSLYEMVVRPRPLDLTRFGLDLDDLPFTLFWVRSQSEADRFTPVDVSFRPADEERWASLRYRIPLTEIYPGADATVKQWVNDWWPPPCPDLPLRTRGRLRWIPPSAETPSAPRPSWWVSGLDHHGTQGLTAHLGGTNVEVRLPDGVPPDHPVVSELVSRFSRLGRGPVSWYARAYHPHRDIPDRGWGDGLVTDLDWAPWAAAPEHANCPAPDLLQPRHLPHGWTADATGARNNPRLDHRERQWVVIDGDSGDPLLWARAVPLTSRHRHPLLARVDARYRLDWEETPVGWAGSLDPRHGHHVVLLERGDLRIEVWVGLHAALDRAAAAALADKIFT